MTSILMNLVFVLLGTLAATLHASVDNATSIQFSNRMARVNLPAVKLNPHDSRSSKFKCHNEGFYADQNDCTVFYRCADSGKGKYAVYRFQCGPGTVYDPETSICNHPENTRRSQCGGLNRPSHNENEVDQLDKHPITTTTTPQPATKPTTSSSRAPVIYITTTTEPSASNSPQWTIAPGSNRCISDGFMGDSNDCRKFYRCVDSGRGTFIRYEFACSSSTVWDEDLQGCNHAWAVKSKKCGSQSIALSTESSKLNDDNYLSNSGISQPQSQLNYDSGSSQSQSHANNESRVNQTHSQLNYATQSSQSQRPIKHGSVVIQSQIQSNYDKHNIQTQSQKNYNDRTSQTQTKQSARPEVTKSSVNNISTTSTRAPRNQESSGSDVCTNSGFMGDSKDCKKFYRCVDNGKSYTRYEFSCGEGTVWDQEIEACNHAWAVKTCGGKGKPQGTNDGKTSSKNETSTTTEPYSTKLTSKLPKIKTTTARPVSESTTKVSSPSGSKNICTGEGFVGDPVDCKKFYRCVNNGQGGFIKYEFSCGQGTVWDSEIESCNHDWAVKTCGGSQLAQKPDESETSTHSPTDENEFGNSNSGSTVHTSSESTTLRRVEETTKQTTSQPSSHKIKCSREGFVGDDDDCKIFYRCVDNGKGGYIQYEFSCGQGTVWDPEIESCNHAWAVPKCGGHKVEQDKGTTEKHSSTAGYKEENTQSTQAFSTTEPIEVLGSHTSAPTPSKGKSSCIDEGFFGDTDDCKKFYRCVDNGKGGFTKYEFTCGEGTAWDPEVEGCNHEDSVQDCSKTTKNPSNNASSQESESSSQEKSTTEKSQVDKETNKEDKDCDKEENKGETSKPPPDSNDKCSSEGFFGYKSDCKKFYRCVSNDKGGFTKYDFNCGEGTVWDPEIEGCNHADGVKSCSGGTNQTDKTDEDTNPNISTTEKSTEEITSTSTMKSTTSSNKGSRKCTSEGFYPDPHDCKQFYRCVENGKGGYTKYDFSCGEGTLWDPEIEGCNHEDSVKNCGNSLKQPPEQSSESSSNESTSTTEEKDCDKDKGSSSTTSKTTTESKEDTSTPRTPNKGSSNCSADGFYPDPKDCKKFYRCVDNGKGGYTKYDFTCGEGTLWDQEIEGCNHESAVKCNEGSHQQQESNTDKDNAQTSVGTTTEVSTTTTIASSSDSKTESSTVNNKDRNCSSEGFYANEKNCKKFYRCVDNGKGGYTRYDFECGEGTLWDQEIQGCNHENAVVCSNKQEHSTKSETSSTAKSTTATQESSKEDCTTEKTSEGSQESQGSKPSGSQNTCEKEGFFGDSNDCKKFYRCVDNGKGGLTKYDFTCGEGTIWDQEITGCNHEWAVENPSCKGSSGTQPQSTTQASQHTTSSQSSSSELTENQESQSTTKEPCDKNETKSENNTISCPHAGFYPHPSDCKKFYRCVDWDGNSEKYSVFHFDCGEGTIWDPKLETCNFEESVYPRRDCGGRQSAESGTTVKDDESSTSESTTQEHTDETNEPSTETQTTTTKKSTTSTATTTTTTTTTERTTTESKNTESTTTAGSTTEGSSSDSTTTQETITEATTTEGTTTSESPKMEGTSTSEGTPTTTEQSPSESTTSESSSETSEPTTSESTLDESTTLESTTSESTSSESTTSESISSQSTTSESTTSESTTSESTISESTTSASTTESTDLTTEEQTTEPTEVSTTESGTESSTTESTTESSSESSTNKDCPETEEGQYLYVCPTGFKRHPKYCNLFYQCTNSPNDHDVKVAVFHCPNNTIYDGKENQCLPEDDTEEKCEGQIAETESRRLRQLNDNSSPPTSIQTSCPREGHFSFEKENKCSHLFLKCQRSFSNKRIQGFVHQCPEGFIYWTISRRCERAAVVNGCSKASKFRRWEIPMETLNIAV